MTETPVHNKDYYTTRLPLGFAGMDKAKQCVWTADCLSIFVYFLIYNVSSCILCECKVDFYTCFHCKYKYKQSSLCFVEVHKPSKPHPFRTYTTTQRVTAWGAWVRNILPVLYVHVLLTHAEIVAHRTSRRSVVHQSRWKNLSKERKEQILQNEVEGWRRCSEMYKK